jgi:anti-anti-sigma factor
MGSKELEINEDTSLSATKFILKGRVNATSADEFLNRLETALKKKQKKIVVNMHQVEYLSSIGIRAILKIYKQAAETGCKFNIENPSESVKNVLGMVALNEMMV